MTRGRRNIALAALALIALGVAFALARGGDGEDARPAAASSAPPPAESPAPSPTAPSTTPADEPPPETNSPAAPAPAPTPAEPAPDTAPSTPAEPQPLRIETKGGKPIGGVAKITAKKDDVVRFIVVSDVAEEVHVHGYDLIENVGPGAPARFRFEATLEGIFEVELEHSGEQIVELRVEP